MTAGLLLALAALGAAISVYFTLAYYGGVQSREVPGKLCRREENTCVSILTTPYARLLGVPNALLGIAFYALTAAVGLWRLAGEPPSWLAWGALVASAATVLAAPYLIWALVVRLKTWCRL